jgi:hypothetical protein
LSRPPSVIEKEILKKLDEIIHLLETNQAMNRENSKLLKQNSKTLENIAEKLHNIANSR